MESFKLAQENNDVSTKTIQRDVKFMKEHWDLPISSNKSMGGYEYTVVVMDFPAIKLTEDEVFAFLIAPKKPGIILGNHNFYHPSMETSSRSKQLYRSRVSSPVVHSRKYVLLQAVLTSGLQTYPST